MKQRYVVGFLFSDNHEIVCMIQKNRPDWQAGLLNGIGGKIEEGESAIYAMVREFEEETGVLTTYETCPWYHVATLYFPQAEVDFFAAHSSEMLDKVESRTDEEVFKVHTVSITDNILPVVDNIPHMIQLSLERLLLQTTNDRGE